MRADVIVAGTGPAGLALAAALVGAGLETVLVGRDHDARWPATYGVWRDDLDELDVLPEPDTVVARSWDDVVAVGNEPHHLGRTYALLDNDALHATLRTATAGCTTVEAGVAGATTGRRGVTVVTSDGRLLEAALAVDATGSWPALLLRPPRPRPAYQAAYGFTARFDRPPGPPGAAVLMDWAGPPGPDPTFLYAFDLGDGRWFVEETSLARRPALHDDVLQARLLERLRSAGAEPLDLGRTEHVLIPMGQALPYRTSVVGFGAAASMVHPATGYSVARSLRVAPRVAAAVADALQVRRATPAAVAAAAWDAVWPPAAQRARALEVYGLEALLRLDRARTQAFFDAFFQLPAHQWQGYLAGTLGPGEVRALMGALFAAVPNGVRWRLAAGNPLPLLRRPAAG